MIPDQFAFVEVAVEFHAGEIVDKHLEVRDFLLLIIVGGLVLSGEPELGRGGIDPFEELLTVGGTDVPRGPINVCAKKTKKGKI